MVKTLRMKNYFWVPMDDTDFDPWAVGRAEQVLYGFTLPRVHGRDDWPDGEKQAPETGSTRRPWTDVTNYCKVLLCCHGASTSLKQIGFKTSNGVVMWEAGDLVNALRTNLSSAGKPIGLIIDWHLTACWGANRFGFWSDSFGKRLADAMKRAGFKGTLTAYKGATSLNVYGDYQKGSSRITTGLLSWKDVDVHNSPGLAKHSTSNRMGVQVFHYRKDMEVTWPLGI